MKRRDFIALLGGAAIAWPIPASGQQQAGKARRIGVFVPSSVQTHGQYVTAFRNKLNTLGYGEGTDYVLLIHWGEGTLTAFLITHVNWLKQDQKSFW